MPNPLRMPMFYLGLLLLGLLSWAVMRPVPPETAHVAARPIPATSSSSGPTPEPAPGTRTQKAEDEPALSDPVLRTPDGLRRKAVVADLGVRPWTAPRGGSVSGDPLDYFDIVFLLSEPPAGSNRVQVGDRLGNPIGWVSESALMEWDSRLMALPSPNPDRPRLRLYENSNCLLDRLANRPCPLHGNACPIAGEEPESTTPQQPATLGWPILASREIPQPDGSSRTILKVACLVRDEAPIVEPSRPPPDLVPMLKELDIAFVIDTTASMQNTIDAVKSLARSLVEATRNQYAGMRLRLALVEYRDHSPAFDFESRRSVDFTDPASFEAALANVSAAPRGDGSLEEAVLAGLRAALPHEPGDNVAVQPLSWPSGRAGDLATRMIVLLGDAPDHAHDPQAALKLAARARRQRVTIASVSILKPGVLKGDEITRYQQQWHDLAAASYRPADPSRGFASAIPPLELTLSDQPLELVSRLHSLIDDRIAQARSLAALAQAEAEGRLQEYTNSQGLRMDQVAPVLADLHRGESQPSPRQNRRLEGRVAPNIRIGWIPERDQGKTLIDRYVLMSKPELDTFLERLIQVRQGLETSPGQPAELLRIETDALAGETSATGKDRQNLNIAEVLRRRAGLPPPSPKSLLSRSPRALLQADSVFRAALERRLQKAIDLLLRTRSAPFWNDPSRLNHAMGLVPYSAFDI